MDTGTGKKIGEKDASEEGEEKQNTRKPHKGKLSAYNDIISADEDYRADEDSKEAKIEEKIELNVMLINKSSGVDLKINDFNAVRKQDLKCKDVKKSEYAAAVPAKKLRSKSKNEESAYQK